MPRVELTTRLARALPAATSSIISSDPRLHNAETTAPLFTTSGLFDFPTSVEIQACWELCRLHNNIGFWVVWLPSAWSIAMVYHAQPQISALVALTRAAAFVPLCFGVKSLIMTIDDLLDSDVDAMVERTKTRPLPRGTISHERAWLFFSCQVFVGLYLALNFLGSTTLHLSMLVWPLYVIYPTCKRWTNLAPIPLGLMFKVGIFMGWSDLSVDGTIPWATLVPIYIGACMWTFTYETVYQHQDKADDIRIGLHSPALLFAEYTIPLCTLTALGFLGLLCYGGASNGHGTCFYVGVVLAGALLLGQLSETDIDKPAECRRLFLGTPLVGQVILVGLLFDVISSRLADGIPL